MKNLVLSLAFILCSLFTFSQSNQYIHFDGVDDYVTVNEASQYIANNNQISMTGWFYSDVLRYGSGMMGFRGEGTGSGAFYILQLSDGKLECRLQTNTGTYDVPNGIGTINANQWHHIAFVYNGSTVESWVDGVSIGSASANGVIQSLDKPFGIGKSLIAGFNFLYQGRADEVSVWSKALTETEINNLMTNELVGNETNLELYYKCDQGFPNGDNTTITKLYSETGSGTKDGSIVNLELMGNSSNFGGTLDAGIQAISFPQVANKTTQDNPFDLNAISTSGLAVTYEIVSGPASVSGNTITLYGTAGVVEVKAMQSGNGTYSAADELTTNFQVLEPNAILANIDIRNPITGSVYCPTLSAIELAAAINIDFPELFEIHSVEFEINGEKIGIKYWDNFYYTGWWTPPSYGSFTFDVTAINNYGASYTKSIIFDVVQTNTDINVDAFTDAWVNNNIPSIEIDVELPSYVGAFDDIIGTLDIVCPPGGCDPWDMVSSVEAQGNNGEWYQIIRYITPYGVACTHQIDLTDFMSILQGKTKFRINLGTNGNGFEYNLNIDYQEGIPLQKYTKVDKLWQETYQFGDYANIQPCEIFNFEYAENTITSKIKLVSTGHGWGDLNSGNAAEFHDDTHHIWVNGSETFTQNNWQICNPNPDDCSPQSGTWTYSRAGWCPGSIAQFFDYDMTPFVSSNSVELKYIFDENYVDLCHPNHPNCVTGVTCNDCNAGFNPHLIVKSYVISKSNTPFDIDTIYSPVLGVKNIKDYSDFYLYPNPSAGKFIIDLQNITDNTSVEIFDYQGRKIKSISTKKNKLVYKIDISSEANGVYIIKIGSSSNIQSKFIIKE